jgi:hypothetical protein
MSPRAPLPARIANKVGCNPGIQKLFNIDQPTTATC